jgi:hypothetical protein
MTATPAPQAPRPAPRFPIDSEQILRGLAMIDPVEREHLLSELEAELNRQDRQEAER